MESIKVNGVLSPVLIRPTGMDTYEMISGHRRLHAAQLAGLTAIPSIIREMTDDEAVIAMVDANIQREELLPSEKAFAYKMKMDAVRRQAGRPKNNLSHNETNYRADEVLSEQVGDSRAQIRRYIRLTELIPELLEYLDLKRISANDEEGLVEIKDNLSELLDDVNGLVATSLSRKEFLYKSKQIQVKYQDSEFHSTTNRVSPFSHSWLLCNNYVL